MNPYLAAALAGVVATVPMTALMSAGHRRLPVDEQYPLPPRELTDEVTRRTDTAQALSEPQTAALSLALHFGYGGVTGALYPLVTKAAPDPQALVGGPMRQTLFGSAFGVAVWAGSYLGWIPAMGLLGPATVQPPARRRLMVGVHLVWGAATVLVGERLASRDSGRVYPRRSQSLGIIE